MAVIPGVALSGATALAGVALSWILGVQLLGFERSPVSPVMTAILLGLAVSNTVRLPAAVRPGIGFSVAKLLRVGIVLLGLRLSVAEILLLGALGVPIVLGCIAGALVVTLLLARALRLPEKLGTLIAVGSSICGVSAIVATGAAIGSKDDEIAYAVSVITIFGLVATVFYPYLANALFLADSVKAGLFLGTAVHDTSQVTGAAVVYAQTFSRDQVINGAVVTKLVRNTFMALVIPLVTFYHARRSLEASGGANRSARNVFPLFIVGFLVLAGVRSLGDISASATGSAFWVLPTERWAGLLEFLNTAAVGLLVVALAGVGLNTRYRDLKRLGLKPFLTGFAAAATVGAISIGLIFLLGRFVESV